MTKESTYSRQCLDCNCNDCTFFIRDFQKLNYIKQKSYEYEINSLEVKRQKLLESALFHNKRGNSNAASKLFKERFKISDQIKKLQINQCHNDSKLYGLCVLKQEEITTIPNILLLDTQDCFIHRNDLDLLIFFNSERKRIYGHS